MKRFTTFPELAQSQYPEVAEFVKANIMRFGEGMNDAVTEYLDGTLSLMDFGGGDAFVVETEEDLKQIDTLAGIDAAGSIVERLSDKAVRSANITETASDYDGAEYIANGKYVFIFLATNNAGGATYYIPREIADKHPTIAESIARAEGNCNDQEPEA